MASAEPGREPVRSRSRHGAGPDPERLDELVLALAPWMITTLLHVAVVLLAVFVVWSTVRDVDGPERIVPDARFSVNPKPPLNNDLADRRPTSGGGRTENDLRDLIGYRGGDGGKTVVTLPGNPAATPIGLSHSRGEAKPSPFGSEHRAQRELGVTFIVRGNAKRIVYLIDASGSLIDTLPFVIQELKRSISELSDRQRFAVIFFQGGDYVEVPPAGLRPATLEVKRRAIAWMDGEAGHVIPMSGSSPLAALRAGLRYKPQLMFVLSDNITGRGRYEVDQRRLLEAVNEANAVATKINAIQFLYADPLTRYGLPPTLELLADRYGGRYKFLDARELAVGHLVPAADR